MPEINLLKNEIGGRKSPLSVVPQSPTVFYVVFAVFIVALLIYGYLFISENRVENQIAQAAQERADIDLEISKTDEKRIEAILLQKRIANTGVLLNEHLMWSILLTRLEDFTYQGAYYDSLQAEFANGELLLTGIAPTYTDLAKLFAGLKQSPEFENVTLTSVGLSEGESAGYTFDISITFDQSLFTQ